MALNKTVPLAAVTLVVLGIITFLFTSANQSSQPFDTPVKSYIPTPEMLEFTTPRFRNATTLTVKVNVDCFTDLGSRPEKKQQVLQVSTKCLIESTGGRHEALWAKYSHILNLLEKGWSVLVLSQDVRLLVNNVLDFTVGDSDLELRTTACPHHTAKEHWYRFGASANFDTYNGFWDIPQKNAWLCNVPWYWLSATYDPAVFYVRPTLAAQKWVGEMKDKIATAATSPQWSTAFEDFSETETFNALTVYREDKYLLVRRFPVNYFWSDVCTRHITAPESAVGRIRHVTFPLEKSKELDKIHRPMDTPVAAISDAVPDTLKCSPTEGDDLCKAMWKVGLNVSGQMSVGICILKGNFLTVQEPNMARVPRADVALHTLCACLDDEGCESCKALGAVPFRMEMNLVLPGAEGKGLVNIYKYYLALAVLRRGFGVLSFDLDVVFLRSPWSYFTDPEIDLFISTDAHSPGWQSSMQDRDVFVYRRACVNTGLWYVKPTAQGKNLFHRVTGFFNATGTKETDFFFEQAMVHVIIMQTRAAGYKHAQGDVRYRLLPTRLFMNSKSTLVLDTDPAAVCSAVSVHANYYCPHGVIHRNDKGSWLNQVAQACTENQPQREKGWAAENAH